MAGPMLRSDLIAELERLRAQWPFGSVEFRAIEAALDDLWLNEEEAYGPFRWPPRYVSGTLGLGGRPVSSVGAL